MHFIGKLFVIFSDKKQKQFIESLVQSIYVSQKIVDLFDHNQWNH